MPELTFSKKVKGELATASYPDEALKPLLSGLIRTAGSVVIGRNPQLKIKTEIASLAKLIFNSFKRAYGVTASFQYLKKMQFDKATVYTIVVSAKVDEILKELECFENLERLKPRAMVKNNNFRYFVIGLFLGGGMISDPAKKHYYLELAFIDSTDSEVVLKKLLALKDEKRCSFKPIKRREKYLLYLKRSDEIAVFLAYIGAPFMMMEYENTRLTKDYVNNENRLNICVQANYEKAAATAAKNLEDIELIERRVGLFAFDEKTRTAIDIRKNYIDASYTEIAAMMNDRSIPITKSGVVHIFTKLHDFAAKLRL